MTVERSRVGDTSLDQSQVLELARRRGEPAVTILMPVAQPVAAHPGMELRLRALVDRALDVTETWWGADAAKGVATQLHRPELQPDPRAEVGKGLAILVTPDDGQLLHLPFAVVEQVVVDRTFATRQLLEGIARNPRYRVLVLDGHHARMFQGEGHQLVEVRTHGFPVHVEPPHEQDTPQKDFPIHEEAEREEHRIVYRAVDDALESACEVDPLPVVVTGAERELVLFEEVTTHGGRFVGQVAGNYAHTHAAELATVVRPVLDAHRAAEQTRVLERLREAHGRESAVFGLSAVQKAAAEGRGNLLAVEEGFTFPGHVTDGLTPGDAPDERLDDLDEVIDDVIETVLLAGGQVEFVEDGALAGHGRIGMLLRY